MPGEAADHLTIDGHGRLAIAVPSTAATTSATSAAHVSTAFWVAGIVLLSTAVRFLLAAQSNVPWLMPDELIYSDLGRSFASTGHFAVRGEPFSAWSFGPLYPVVIAPAFALFGSLPRAYLAVKAINCVLFSSAAVPSYLLAKPLLDRRRSLLFCAFATMIPSAVYTTRVMTESLAYPVFLWALLAMIAALRRPSAKRQILALLATALAVAARAEMVVLVPAYVVAILLLVRLSAAKRPGSRPRIRNDLRRAAEFRVTWIALGAGLPLGLAGSIAQGRFVRTLLGIHTVLLHRVRPLGAPLGFLYHIAGLELYTSIVPVLAFAVITTSVVRRHRTQRELQLFSAVAIPITLAFLLLIAVYSTQPKPEPKIFDRYLFYLVPLLLLAFFVWAKEGLPRDRLRKPLAVVGITLPFIPPYSQLLTQHLGMSQIALVPWGVLRVAAGTPLAVYPVLAVGGVALTWSFLRPSTADAATLFIVANFALTNILVSNSNANVSREARSTGIGTHSNPSWIDATVGRDANVATLWSGVDRRTLAGRYAIWESEFFNRSVKRVYDLAEPTRIDLRERRVVVHGRTVFIGSRQPLRAKYVLTDVRTPVVGRRIAFDRGSGLVLYRVSGAVLLARTG